MKRPGALALAIAVAAATDGAPAQADADHYRREPRVAALSGALAAVRGLGTAGRTALEQELYQGARGRCRAGQMAPTIGCLIAMAEQTCQARPASEQSTCRLAADVIITNQLAENQLVPEPERLRLLAGATDYRTGMRAQLTLRYTALAAELALAEPGTEAELPARIDRFCAARERQLAWQRCVAALVWHIGTHEGGSP